MNIIAVPLLALVFALGTGIAGWWAVPVLAFGWGVLARRRKRRVLVAAAAGALAWTSMLVLMAARGEGAVAGFGARVAASLELPAAAPALATALFPALVAALAAATGSLLFADSATENNIRSRRGRSG
ncbi:MAG: hypothetical protein ACT4OZ_01510 [Gemmatimonadota bacterium]